MAVFYRDHSFIRHLGISECEVYNSGLFLPRCSALSAKFIAASQHQAASLEQ